MRNYPTHPYDQRNPPPTLMIREIPHPPLQPEKYPTDPYDQRASPATAINLEVTWV